MAEEVIRGQNGQLRAVVEVLADTCQRGLGSARAAALSATCRQAEGGSSGALGDEREAVTVFAL